MRLGLSKYKWIIVVLIGLIIVTGIFMPIILTYPAFVTAGKPLVGWILALLTAIVLGWIDYRLIKLARYDAKHFGDTGLWVSVVMQSVWLLSIVWFMLQVPNPHGMLLTMTLPIYLVGLLGLTINYRMMQRLAQFVLIGQRQLSALKHWNTILTFFVAYALLFFGLTVNWQTGLTIAVAVGLIVDPIWPAIRSGWHRKMILYRLAHVGVDVKGDTSEIDHLRDIKHVVIEKSGILTSAGVVIRTVQSYDDRYSDFDILGIVAGLVSDARMTDFQSPLSIAIETYARKNGVFPSKVTEPEYLPAVGVKGVIQNQRYAFVSATYAREHYDVNERHFQQINDLGNSVSYLVENDVVIGVVAFQAPTSYSVISLDKFFRSHGIQAHIISADTTGSVEQVTNILKSVVEVKSGLQVEEKEARQKELLTQPDTLLITNQRYQTDLGAQLVVGVGNRLDNADIKVWSADDLPQLWQAADDLKHDNTSAVLNMGLIMLILLILAAGLGIFASSWLFIAPIIAVVIRMIVTGILYFIQRPQSKK